LGLTGNLGGGKTTFMQGLQWVLGVKEKILSPTFVIMKHFGNFYHIDCYRINKPEEIFRAWL
jgi:tRNA threonylcarbamoyladenosine biosynthesis protein TsaE